jgi:hypothetical protein
VAPIITGIIVQSRFHIRCISMHKLFFNLFSASFWTTLLLSLFMYHSPLIWKVTN